MGNSAGGAKRGVTARVTVPSALVGERVDEPDQVVWSRLDPAPAPEVPARIVLPAARTPAASDNGDALAAATGSDGASLPSSQSRPMPRPRYDPTSGETTMRLPVVPAEPEPLAEPDAVPLPVEDLRPEPGELFEPLVPPLTLPDPAAPRPPDPLASDVEDVEATPIFAEVTSGWFHAPAARSFGGGSVGGGVATRSRHGVDGPDPSAFVTSADAVWQAARAATESQTAGFTEAGLPIRVPRGRLMPGSVTPGEPPPSISGRDPEAVRGRLSTFQRGVRHGRHIRGEEDSS
jgi:hypothetical protein